MPEEIHPDHLADKAATMQAAAVAWREVKADYAHPEHGPRKEEFEAVKADHDRLREAWRAQEIAAGRRKEGVNAVVAPGPVEAVADGQES